jgi:hypothetical protein
MEMSTFSERLILSQGAVGLPVWLATENLALGILSGIAAQYLYSSFFEEFSKNGKWIIRNINWTGSFFNYANQVEGLRWTRASQIISKYSKKDDFSFYLGNFSWDWEVVKEASFLSKRLAKLKKVRTNKNVFYSDKKDLFLNFEALKRGSLIIGSMGSGKSVFLTNILNDWLKTGGKAVIHDTKGEFTAKFYNQEVDYIINPLDERGVYINFFDEIEKGLDYSLIEEFFSSYFLAVAGDKGDQFWREMAGIRFKEKFEELMLNENLTSKEKMTYLISDLIKYIKTEAPKKGKTEQSIATNLEINLDIFIRMLYLQEKGAKQFSFVDFIKSDNSSKIFLHTIEAVDKINTPFITAFLTLLFRLQLTQQAKSQNEYTLYVLDEYLKFFNKMSEDIKVSVHTKARSSGILLLPAVQYLPQKEEDKKNLLSSVENLFIFNINDIDTIEAVKKIFGKVRTHRKLKDTEEVKEYEFVETNTLQNLATGQFITNFVKQNEIFLTYTKPLQVKEKTNEFIQNNSKNYIEFKNKMLNLDLMF